MSKLLFCCLKSFLKGDSDNELYEVLELNRNASSEDIRKAYKKVSLQLHPDKLAQRGIEVTDEHKATFLKVKEAYEILGDPKRKKTYDSLGYFGLKLKENPTDLPISQLIANYQKNSRDRLQLFFIILVIFSCIAIFPILFALRCDNTIKFRWSLVWIPLWVFNLVLFLVSLSNFLEPTKKNDEENEKKKTLTNTNEEEEESYNSEHLTLFEKILQVLEVSLFILIQIFLIMKLDHDIDWNWFVVFIPWYLFEFFSIISVINILKSSKFSLSFTPSPEELEEAYREFEREKNRENDEEDRELTGLQDEEKFHVEFELNKKHYDQYYELDDYKWSIVQSLLDILLAILIAVKLEADEDEREGRSDKGGEKWSLYFLPIWVYFTIQFVRSYLYHSEGNTIINNTPQVSLEEGLTSDNLKNFISFYHASIIKTKASYLLYSQIIPIIIFFLLAMSLDVSSFSTFLIIIPVFIILGCCFLSVFGFFCCLSCVNPDDYDPSKAGAEGEQEGVGVYQPPSSTGGSSTSAAATSAAAPESPIVFMPTAYVPELDEEQGVQQEEVSLNLIQPTGIDDDID